MSFAKDLFSKNNFSEENFSENFEKSKSEAQIHFYSGVFRRHHVLNDPINGIDPSGLATTLYNDGVHQVLGVDDPSSPTGVTYIDFNPATPLYSTSAGLGFPTTAQGWVSPITGQVDIGSSYSGGPLSAAQTFQTTALQEQELISLASLYQFMASQGQYSYQALPGGGGNNCRSFVSTLLNTVGAK